MSPIAGDTQLAPAGVAGISKDDLLSISLSLFLPSSFHPPVTHPDGVTPRPKRYPAKSSPRRRRKGGGKYQRRAKPPCCIALVNFCAEASRFFSPSTRSRLRCPGRPPSLLPFLPVDLPPPHPSVTRRSHRRPLLRLLSAPIFATAFWDDRINLEHTLANASCLRHSDFTLQRSPRSPLFIAAQKWSASARLGCTD